MHRTRFMFVAAVAALSLVAAACGNDEESPAAASPETEATSPTPDEEMVTGMTITDIVADSPDFTTLLAAVQEADLGDALAGEGP